MKIHLNGDKIETTGTTLDEIITQKGFNPSGLVAEVNLKIIKRTEWKQKILKTDDKIELVTFVGGG